MARKCPICGSKMIEIVPCSGDLIQRYSSQYGCTKCSFKTKTEDELLAEALRTIEREMEETGDGGN